jgi:ribosome-associated protein
MLRAMIRVTHAISIDSSEIQERFVRSSGPGGQNVNKVSTAVQLRFDVRNSPNLSEDVRRRLTRLAGRRLTDSGVLIVEARSHRTQQRNRLDASRRLIALIRKAAQRPKLRLKTAPTAASKRRRADSKCRRSRAKSLRRAVGSAEGGD